MKGKSRPTVVEELGYSVLAAVIEAELSPDGARKIWSHKHRQTPRRRRMLLNRFGRLLGADDPVGRAYQKLDREVRRRSSSLGSLIGHLDPDRRHPSEWSEQTSQGLRRAWREGRHPARR